MLKSLTGLILLVVMAYNATAAVVHDSKGNALKAIYSMLWAVLMAVIAYGC